MEPKDKLYHWREKLTLKLKRSGTLFIIDHITAIKTLDKQRQPLLELAISGRHPNHYL